MSAQSPYNLDFQANNQFWEEAWQRVSNAINTPPKLSYIDKIVPTLKKYPIRKVVDMACGSGWLSFMLAQADYQVLGLDISESAIKLADNSLKLAEFTDIKNKVDFQVANMLNLEATLAFKPDLLVFNAALEHLSFQQAMDLFYDAAKLLNFQNENYILAIFDEVAQGDKGEYNISADGARQYHDQYREGMIIRYYDDQEREDLFKKAGFKIIEDFKTKEDSRFMLAVKN
jgi:SAM-dependent methyltransferase